jgi:cytidylate kinase
LSGLTASGKTTHAHILAGIFGLQYVSSTQIFLALNKLSPFQSPDFWVTDIAKEMWHNSKALDLEDELCRLASSTNNVVFDAFLLPWFCPVQTFNIWLESDLDSRHKKAVVSHRNVEQRSDDNLRSRLTEKDDAAANHLKKHYAGDLYNDRSHFNLVLDISTLIKEPTVTSSLKSICITQEILTAATGFELTGDKCFHRQLNKLAGRHPEIIVSYHPSGQ